MASDVRSVRQVQRHPVPAVHGLRDGLGLLLRQGRKSSLGQEVARHVENVVLVLTVCMNLILRASGSRG